MPHVIFSNILHYSPSSLSCIWMAVKWPWLVHLVRLVESGGSRSMARSNVSVSQNTFVETWFPMWGCLQVGPVGGDEVMGWSPHEQNLCSYKREPAGSVAPSAMDRNGEKTARHLWTRKSDHTRHLVHPYHQTSSPPLLPWSWIAQPPELWELNVCCLR